MANPEKDYISFLPNDILHKILALLPMEDATRTSCLSTRFRRLPFSNPNLNFEFSSRMDEIENHVTSIIDSYLIQASKTPRIQVIKFPLVSTTSLRRWIRFAADHDVTEIVFSGLYAESYVEIPRTLFECESLESVKMMNCSLDSVPIGREKLSRLKTVVLACVNVKNEVLNGLMAICPAIETLAVMDCRGLTRITIMSPTLKSLTVNCDDLKQFDVLWAPQLHYFMYDGDLTKIKLLEGLTNLEEAVVQSSVSNYDGNSFFENRKQFEDLISSLAHVKILSVNNWFSEEGLKSCKSKTVFNNLKEFHYLPVCNLAKFCGWSSTDFNEASLLALVSTIKDFPSLELLCFHGNHYKVIDESDEDEQTSHRCGEKLLENFNNVPNLLPRLKTVQMIEFSMRDEEVDLVKFLSSKALGLKSMVLYHAFMEEEKLREMHELVGSVRKTSKELNISLIQDTYEYYSCPKLQAMWWNIPDF